MNRPLLTASTAVILLAAPVILMVACSKQEQAVERTTNAAINVDLLFEKDGYRVHRFFDGGRAVYYVTPAGQAVEIHSEACGKGCVREVRTQAVTSQRGAKVPQ